MARIVTPYCQRVSLAKLTHHNGPLVTGKLINTHPVLAMMGVSV